MSSIRLPRVATASAAARPLPVSSAHADLVCKDGRFFLQVLPPGCAIGGNSTRIIRDQKPIELDQPSLSYPLLDGDLIELGRAVLLEFRIRR